MFGPHIQGDIMQLESSCWSQFDLAICHPPCTYLSNAGARHLYPGGILNEERYILGLAAKELFLHCLNLPIPHIAVENPTPSKIYELPPYNQAIQPYEHGHSFQKRTCLWLKSLPELKPTKVMKFKQNTKQSGNWFNKGNASERQKNRSRTFPGIAEAMATQWGDIL